MTAISNGGLGRSGVTATVWWNKLGGKYFWRLEAKDYFIISVRNEKIKQELSPALFAEIPQKNQV
jgi:hypothetical protein